MTLHTLLDDAARYDAEYGHNLANHLPMALVALSRLGAGDERMAAYAAHYIERHRLQPLPSEELWPAGDAWQRRFGNPRAWPLYRALFREWIAVEGARDMLPQVLPPLMRGCGAAAFHGLIRCGYALDSGRVSDVADALAYWAARWFSVGDVAQPGSEDEPAALLMDLRAIPKPPQGLIAERMASAATHERFAAIAGALRIDDAKAMLQRLATLAAQLYAQSGNFTVLHLVTSAHALRVLLPYADEDDHTAIVRSYWWGYAAGVAAAGLKPGATIDDDIAWGDIVDAAIASDDEHVIKLVDSCREQQAAYDPEGDSDVWRAAAARAVLQDVAWRARAGDA